METSPHILSPGTKRMTALRFSCCNPAENPGTDFTEGRALPQNRSGRFREPLPGNKYQFAGCAVSTVDRQSTD